MQRDADEQRRGRRAQGVLAGMRHDAGDQADGGGDGRQERERGKADPARARRRRQARAASRASRRGDNEAATRAERRASGPVGVTAGGQFGAAIQR